MKLKHKFLIIFLLLTTVPVIIISTYTYQRYTELIEDRISQVADSIFDKAVLESNQAIGEVKRVSEMFHLYSESQESLVDDIKKYGENGSYTYYDVFLSNRLVNYVCKNIVLSNDHINGVYIFTPSGIILDSRVGNGNSVKDGWPFEEDSWYQKTLENEGQFTVSGISKKDFIIQSSDSIGFSQAIYDILTHEFLGVLYIDCSPDIFDLTATNTLPDIAMLAIENKEGEYLYTSVDSLKTDLTPKNTRTQKISLDLEGLDLIFSINYESLYHEFGYTQTMMLTIAVICMIVTVTLSLYFSYSLTKPIVHLSKKMATKGTLNLKTTSRYLARTDEIGVLYNEYNNMLETLGNYIEKELQNKLITLDSQMKSLEAQINSHFLYNTLESINSIAEIEEVESIATMSLALGNMFRYSIKTQSELVTITDELKHVQDYISIQQIRFDNRFQVVLLIPEEMYAQKVLKLIMQPIVENALYHGLQYCRTGDRITISGHIKDHCIYLGISDNGVGMSPEQLTELRNSLKEKAQFTELGQRNKQSIGIKNIHTRIALYYGEGYGLHIDSELSEGTTITIKLPVMMN